MKSRFITKVNESKCTLINNCIQFYIKINSRINLRILLREVAKLYVPRVHWMSRGHWLRYPICEISYCGHLDIMALLDVHGYSIMNISTSDI